MEKTNTQKIHDLAKKNRKEANARKEKFPTGGADCRNRDEEHHGEVFFCIRPRGHKGKHYCMVTLKREWK